MREILAVINNYGLAIVNGSSNYRPVVNEKKQLVFKKKGKGNHDPVKPVLYDHSDGEDMIVYKPVAKPNKSKKTDTDIKTDADIKTDLFRYSIVMAQRKDSVLIDLPKQQGETKNNIPSKQTIEIKGMNPSWNLDRVSFNFRTSGAEAISINFDASEDYLKSDISISINGQIVWCLSQCERIGIELHKLDDYMNVIINALKDSYGDRWNSGIMSIIKSIEPGLRLCIGDFIRKMMVKANQSSNNSNFIGNMAAINARREMPTVTRGRRGTM